MLRTTDAMLSVIKAVFSCALTGTVTLARFPPTTDFRPARCNRAKRAMQPHHTLCSIKLMRLGAFIRGTTH